MRFVRAVACCIGWTSKSSTKLKGDQLFDLICVGIFVSTVLFLRQLNAGAIYFWIKDLTQEFLKLQVIYTAVEMFDEVTLFSPTNCSTLAVQSAHMRLNSVCKML